jgi:hypothetical protein|tara:strand:+ start:2658 stop:3203 length:546 start_codon:yes stop_codon:yes gene_type:complete
MAKKLLNEAAVRRFQSLANISPINEMKYEEEKMEEGNYSMEEDEMKEYMTEQEDDMPADDMEAGMDDMDADMGEGMQLTEEEAEVLIDLGKRLEAEMGGMADEEGDMDDMEGGMEDAGMDAPAGEGDEEVLDETDIMEALAGISYIPSQGEIVNEVAQRVARRLKEAKLHESKLNRALGRK